MKHPIRLLLDKAVTRYDMQQSTKRGYNRYALGQYFSALDETENDHHKGYTWKQALERNFCDRLLTVLIKAIPESLIND